MSLRFSDHGPHFPTELINAQLAGNVVFLCGTGISAPQLPDFKALVDQTYLQLGAEKDPSEQRSYDDLRFEEVLGALGRRLADPEAMRRAASERLAMPADPQLEQHRTLLRLSRDQSNRVLIVTTNFDTLLERALGQPARQVRTQSFAGQSLPAPGSSSFSGIIHIHGRLADPELDLNPTPLVLTSADYGDAYMRSGWASRFLFDLARCKTIVLVGYSANDAPVRYFLNVLEADRARFPDLHPVYAFDAYDNDPSEAEKRWGALAVTPLTYCKFNPKTGAPDHSPLWDDLCQLADIIERPKRSREGRARQILVGDSSALTDQQLAELKWLFIDRSDLWPAALDAITDPGWFRVLQENNLWSALDAARVIGAWIARSFEDPQRFAIAVEWLAILGRDFSSNLDDLLQRVPQITPFWLKAWRILISAEPPKRAGHFDGKARALIQKLRSGLILDGELVQATGLLAPKLVASRPWRYREAAEGAGAQAEELTLSNLVALDLRGINEYDATEIIEALSELDAHAVRILELGSEALRSALRQSVDLGMILEDSDWSDYSVPSVEDHDQNKHHDGVIFLVRAVVNAFPGVVERDRERARELAAQWRTWPGRLGTRLLLHAARDRDAFSADEALQLLIDLEDTDFWIIRREFALILRDRAADATPELVDAVEDRIRTGGKDYYIRYIIADDQVDWRDHARDSTVWLRLKMLAAANVLSEAGRDELNAIVVRRPHLNRAIEVPDFFGSFSYGVRTVVGDSGPIVEANPDDRLQVATELRQSRDIDRQMGWSSYCRSDPKGAFETLEPAALTASNVALWGELLTALLFHNDEKDAPLRDQLVVEALERLAGLDTETLQPIAARVVELLRAGPRRRIANLEEWCDRLWLAVRLGDHEIDFGKNLYETAINSAAGTLAQVLLAELQHTRETHGPDEARQRRRLAFVASEEGQAGILARAVLVRDFAFMLGVDAAVSREHLLPRLTGDTDEARGLRAVLVSAGNITPEVTKAAREAVLDGVAEAPADSRFAGWIAAGILRPAITSIREDDTGRWGIGEADVRGVLRKAQLDIRTGTLEVLVGWMHQDGAGVEEAWDKMVAPFFDRVWPKERVFVDEALNQGLMKLVVGAGKYFPKALEKLRPYFSPYMRVRGSVHSITESKVPEVYPYQVLDLLWLVFGPSGGTSYDLAGLLDRLAAADPNIEVDRRFQSLTQRAVRYG